MLALLESVKFFFGFLDDLGNFKHFEPYFFFALSESVNTFHCVKVKQRDRILLFKGDFREENTSLFPFFKEGLCTEEIMEGEHLSEPWFNKADSVLRHKASVALL